MKFVGRFNRVLPGHGVGDKQNFDGIEQRLQLLQFVHQRIVDVETPGGIHQQHIAPVIGSFAAGRTSQIERGGFFGRAGVNRNLVVARDDG